jgi:hypothetical protein
LEINKYCYLLHPVGLDFITLPTLKMHGQTQIKVKKYDEAEQATDDIIRRIRSACWITKATNTRSEYVILIALPERQWFHERTSILRLYVHCLSWQVEAWEVL